MRVYSRKNQAARPTTEAARYFQTPRPLSAGTTRLTMLIKVLEGILIFVKALHFHETFLLLKQWLLAEFKKPGKPSVMLEITSTALRVPMLKQGFPRPSVG